MLTKPDARVLAAAGAADGGQRRQLQPPRRRRLHPRQARRRRPAAGSARCSPSASATTCTSASRCAPLRWSDDGVTADHRRPRPCTRAARSSPFRRVLIQPHLVRAAAAAPPAPAAPAPLDGLRDQGARRLRDAVLARSTASPARRSAPTSSSHEAYDNTQPRRRARHARRLRLRPATPTASSSSVGRGAQGAHPRLALALLRRRGARSPVVYYESDWGSEEWTRGAYAASFDLGGLARYGADLRTPVGPISFSCSDLAGKGYQHVDGAIRVGRETAAAIVTELQSVDPRMTDGFVRRVHRHRCRGRCASPSGCAWRRSGGAVLDIVHRLAQRGAGDARPHRSGLRTSTCASRPSSWLRDAARHRFRRMSPLHTHVVYAESFARGLLVTAARDLSSRHDRRRGRPRRAARPIHGRQRRELRCCTPSHVPVALAPEGARDARRRTPGVSRVTCAVGTRPGADALLEARHRGRREQRMRRCGSSRSSRSTCRGGHDDPVVLAAGRGARRGGARQRARAPARRASRSTPVVASGDSIEDAVAHLDWDPASSCSSARAVWPSRAACSSARPRRRCCTNCRFP